MKYPIPKIALEVCVVLAFFSIPAAAIQITVIGTDVAQTLYDKIVPDPSISNITLIPNTLTLFGVGGATQSATFDYPVGTTNPDLGVRSDGIPFNSGIILTNGRAVDIPGNSLGDENYSNPSLGIKFPEAIGLGSGSNAWDTPIPFGNDTTGAAAALGMLASFLHLPANTQFYDANVLQFQFTLPITSGAWNLSFDYVFASEEYIDFVNSPFNDAFGFFIDQTNVAVLSDGITPISINSINPVANSDLYRNNVPGCSTSPCPNPNPPSFTWDSLNLDLEPDGLTQVLPSQTITLGAGQHTATLVITDVNSPSLDSAVFIREGSFVATPAIPEPGTLILIGTGLAALGLLRRRHR